VSGRKIDFAIQARSVAGAVSLGFFFYVRSFGTPYLAASERAL